jgi:hypothetical protein
MTDLVTIQEFEDELDVLVKTNPADAGLIDALIEELGADHELLSNLSDEVPKWHYMFNPSFEIKRFAECWKTGRRIYSLKPYGEDGQLIAYRIFMAHDVDTDEYFVLTVLPRKNCYDTTTDAFRRLCERYDKLGIPTSGRFQ